MIKLIIFDLDGTLVNAYPAVSNSVNYTLKALGLKKRTHAEIKRSVGGGDRLLMAHFVPEPMLDKAMAVYRPHHAKALGAKGAVRLLPDVSRILKFLKKQGYQLAIASNRPQRFTGIILKSLSLVSFFDMVLCADKAKKPKPYPDMLWAIRARLKVGNAEVVFVGDMTIDLDCAYRAGVRSVAVATGSSTIKELKDLKPWRFIDRMGQLKLIIQGEENE